MVDIEVLADRYADEQAELAYIRAHESDDMDAESACEAEAQKQYESEYPF